MTQDKINKAVELLESAYNKLNLMLEAAEGFHTLGSLSMGNISEAKSLLQLENEGREVDLNTMCCPSCDVMFSDRSLNTLDECMCGQKLIWPDNQESEE